MPRSYPQVTPSVFSTDADKRMDANPKGGTEPTSQNTR